MTPRSYPSLKRKRRAFAYASGSDISFARYKLQCSGVHAVAQAGRRGSIIEDVSEMGTAVPATSLCARHERTAVLVQREVVFIHRLKETRPAGSGVEFRCRIEQRLAAADAAIDAVGMVVPVFVIERRFCAL